MVLCLKIKLWLFAEISYRYILFLIACDNIVIWKVWQAKKKLLLLLVEFLKLCVLFLNLCYKLFHLSHNFGSIAASLLDLRNFLRSCILLSLHSLNLTNNLSAFSINFNNAVNYGIEVHITLFNFCLYFICFFSDKFNINHCYSPSI